MSVAIRGLAIEEVRLLGMQVKGKMKTIPVTSLRIAERFFLGAVLGK